MKTKRVIIGSLAGFMLVGNQTCLIYADDEENTEKEEIIYASLDQDGSVKELTAVNSFVLDKAQEIVDYGTYSSVRNMTSEDAIDYNNNTVKINAKEGKLYYEGKMTTKQLPWNIDIQYYLDNEKITSNDLAGKSGHLKIEIKITENESYEDFYNGYALQASLSLDSNKCTNIKSDNATIANVGGDKQLSYIILPGKGADIEIESDVIDFEMDSISINGVKLNLSLDIDDSSISDKVDTISEAVNELNNGADSLNSGASQLYKATTSLKDNSSKLESGVNQISSEASSLNAGVSALDSKSDSLVNGAYSAFDGLCSAITTVLNDKLTENGLSEVTITPDNYTSVLNDLLSQMDAQTVYDQAYNTALQTVTQQVNTQIEEMSDKVYQLYVNQNASVFLQQYVSQNRETLYYAAAQQTVLHSLIQGGMSEEDATAYLETDEGKQQITTVYTQMMSDTDTSDSTILSNLTDEQKSSILQGVLNALSDEQKQTIKEGVINQKIQETMVSDDVQNQINSAVKQVSEAAGTVSELKGKLDQYAVFYQGVKDYTSAVSSIKSGASTLNDSLSTLSSSMSSLTSGTSELNEAVKKLFDGTSSLKDGTKEFSDKTSNLSDEVSDTINDTIDDMLGADVETGSFVSDKNTNVDSVQFVIKTDEIEKEEEEDTTEDTEESLSFIQKFLKLFGIE